MIALFVYITDSHLKDFVRDLRGACGAPDGRGNGGGLESNFECTDLCVAPCTGWLVTDIFA